MSYQDIIYRHRKGHLYRIVHFGLDEETLEPEVAYRRCDDKGKFLDCGPPFHRRCTVFFDGRFTIYEEPDAPAEEVTNIFADDGMDTMTLETLHPTGEVTQTEVKVPRVKALVLNEDMALPESMVDAKTAERFENLPPYRADKLGNLRRAGEVVQSESHVDPASQQPVKAMTPTERQVEAGWPEGFGDGKL